MTEASPVGPWRNALRRHQRRFIAGYLALVGAGLVAVALPSIRRPLLGAIERGVRWWDDRWARRLAHGRELLARGDVAGAIRYLEQLDRAHPATNVRHARDLEREAVLRALATAYERAGKNGRAIDTYRRLVDFDSLNYRNYLELARASDRLLSGWALAPEARDAYQAVLRRFPAHLPSVRGDIDYYMDRGEFIPVVAAFKSYLDAPLVQLVTISIGTARVTVPINVDGYARDFEVAFPGAAAGDRVRIATDGMSMAIERLELVAAKRVGRVGSSGPTSVGLAGATVSGMSVVGPGRYAATDSLTAIDLPLDGRPVATVRIRVALFKPVDQPLWATVVKSCRNLLDIDGLAALERRVIPLGSPAEADRVLGRLPWTRESLGISDDDFVF